MHPSHSISSAQINLISVNEYAQTTNPARHDIIRLPKGTPSLLIAFISHHVRGITKKPLVWTKHKMTQGDSIVVIFFIVFFFLPLTQ